MGIQIIHDQCNTFSLRVMGINQVTDLMRPINSRSLIGHFNNPFALQGSKNIKTLLTPLRSYSVSYRATVPGFAGIWRTRVFNLLLAAFVMQISGCASS